MGNDIMIDIGSKVVCISDNWDTTYRNIVKHFPIKGNIYTVRGMEKSFEEIGLIFEEFANETKNPFLFFKEYSFDIKCFRPVKKTDISIFEEMLRSTPMNIGVNISKPEEEKV